MRPYAKAYVESYFNKTDEKGLFRSQTLTGAGTRKGESGKAWRRYNPTSKGRHWAFPGALAAELGIEDLDLHEKLDFLADHGLMAETDWLPDYRQYLHNSPGVRLQDIWAYQPFTNGFLYGTDEPIDHDVRWLSDRNDPERLGYPTQKPLGLLSRMISSSSREGDVVLDPFCGCGTAVHAAQKLQRRWIGIDITHLAISLIEKRLRDAFPKIQYEVQGTPKDIDGARNLAERSKYQFQWWACSLVNAQPYQGKRKGADSGIDGMIFFSDAKDGTPKKIIVSVKGGENVNVAMVRDLCHVVDREKAAIGLFVMLAEPTRPMLVEATKEGFFKSETGRSYPKIQVLTIEQLLGGKAQPVYPDLHRGGLTFKKAEMEHGEDRQHTLVFNAPQPAGQEKSGRPARPSARRAEKALRKPRSRRV